MSYNQEDFLRELINDFKIEAEEHYQSLVNNLLELEKNLENPKSSSIIEIVFREVHSLKGAARAVNLIQIEQLCMNMESVFHEIKKGSISLNSTMFESFYQAIDTLKIMIDEIETANKSVSENTLNSYKKIFTGFIKQDKKESMSFFDLKSNKSNNEEIADAKEVKAIAPEHEEEIQPVIKTVHQSPKDPKSNIEIEIKNPITGNETIRVATSKLYDLLRQTEELVSIKAVMDYQIENLGKIEDEFHKWTKKYLDRNKSLTIFEKSNYAEDNIQNDIEFFKIHRESLNSHSMYLKQIQHMAARAIDDLLLDTKKTLMQPFASLLAIVPKLVRDISKEENKETNLEIHGDGIEIDRRILEEMKDPLIHLIRNSISHGIETLQDRKNKNKPEKGNLTIRITQDVSRKITIEIIDDGEGLNHKKIIKSAIKSGIINQDEADKLTDNDINMLIFASGVSTSPFVTDISGRGLGMAIVAEKINKMGGKIEVSSKLNQGTTFNITLPQSLATFRGILVKTSDSLFMIPTNSVLRAITIHKNEIKIIESRQTIIYNEESIGLVNLAEVLGIQKFKNKYGSNDRFFALILENSQKKVAFIVDEMLGEFEGVVKNLGSQLKHIHAIAGTTLLGNGKIAPIIQVSELIETVIRNGAGFSNTIKQEDTINNEEKMEKRILIAEDSITVRNMIKSFIEAAGYSVTTAVDGADAFQKLQQEEYNLLVSDIEMPNMTGFELTANVRKTAALTDLPVILVTTLDSQEDRQKGMDAGANAYIIKGSFEKSNLIETISRFI